MREPFLCTGQSESKDCDISEYRNTRDVIHFALVFAWHSFPSLRTGKSSPSREISLSWVEERRSRGQFGTCWRNWRRELLRWWCKRWCRVSLSNPSWKLLSACVGEAWKARWTTCPTGWELPRNTRGQTLLGEVSGLAHLEKWWIVLWKLVRLLVYPTELVRLGFVFSQSRSTAFSFLCPKLWSLLSSPGLPTGTSGKESAYQCRRHKRHGFNPWVREIPWRRAWQPAPVFLPGESHGQRRLVGYGP